VKAYKVTNQYGTAYAMYEHGYLTMLLSELKPQAGDLLHQDFPLTEFALEHSELYSSKLIVPTSVADKVALFCLLYKHYKKVSYRAMKEEKANLKTVTVNGQLLNTYFTNVNYPLSQTKSMADYVRHYNTVRDLATNGKPVKSAFPNVYDREYEKRIAEDVSKLQRYWAHLRAHGWAKEDGTWIHKSNPINT
jgi:hypothetical protein